MKKSSLSYACQNKRGEYLKRSGGFSKGLIDVVKWAKPLPPKSLERGEKMVMIKTTWNEED